MNLSWFCVSCMKVWGLFWMVLGMVLLMCWECIIRFEVRLVCNVVSRYRCVFSYMNRYRVVSDSVSMFSSIWVWVCRE